jgi:hypothetical protein
MARASSYYLIARSVLSGNEGGAGRYAFQGPLTIRKVLMPGHSERPSGHQESRRRPTSIHRPERRIMELKWLSQSKSAPFARKNSNSSRTSPVSPIAAPNAALTTRPLLQLSAAWTPMSAGMPAKPTKPAGKPCANFCIAKTASRRLAKLCADSFWIFCRRFQAGLMLPGDARPVS